MNVDQYREMIAQEKAEAESKKDQPVTPVVPKEETPATPEVVTPTETKEAPVNPLTDKIKLDDGSEYTLADIKEWRNGYLRTEDYTRKTQEVSSQRKENPKAIELFNYLQANPHIAQAMLSAETTPQQAQQVLSPLSPQNAKVDELEQKLYSLQLQREIDTLSAKYTDFNVVEVLNIAQEKQITNLEDAYKLSIADKPKSQESSAPDVEELKKQLRSEVLKELEKERESTATIISTGDAKPTTPEQPTLSAEEDRVRQMMRLTVEDYTKWRNKK